MLTDEKNTAAFEAYTEAIRNWNCLLENEECTVTMRSIFVTVRLALENKNSDDGFPEMSWLLRMGEYLADIQTYRPLQA
jgi:hypothetical protein